MELKTPNAQALFCFCNVIALEEIKSIWCQISQKMKMLHVS